jgi:CheY-like chemotaxis protein
VLVVDDDPGLRSVLAHVLEGHGFGVTSAADGKEAMRVLRTGPAVDLILLDLMMPVMNGWQFRREQHEDPRIQDIPVLVLSAGQNVAEAAASMGAVGHVRKPIHLPELLSMVGRFCGGVRRQVA